MKRSFQNIEPNYKAIAKLSIDQQFVAAVPCQVWLPRHIYERPFLTFDSAEPEHQIIGKLSPKYDVNISMLDFKGEIHSSIQANDIFLEKFSIWPRGSHDSLLITFQGEPYRLIESQRVESNNVKDHVTMTILYLSDNLLLEPTTIFERYYTGNARVKKVRGHSDSVGPFKEVLFDNHYYYIQTNDGGVATHSKLVAIMTSNYPADDIAAFEEKIRPIINDYLLLSSFAANQRTNIISWQSRDEQHLVKGWYGNVPVETKQERQRRGRDECLIERSEFKTFIKVATKRLEKFSDDDKELIRHAIYAVLPREVRTIESAILSFFSAIESIILIHRRAKDLEFTVSERNRWKKLEQSLRQTINSQQELFATHEHMKMLLKMLPSLRRVPLMEAFDSYMIEQKIDLSDLWPVFTSAEGASLTDIRNRIIHGDAFDERNWQALCHAMDNLECITKRLVLTVLGWDIERSTVSKDVLRRGGWSANSNLLADMKALARK